MISFGKTIALLSLEGSEVIQWAVDLSTKALVEPGLGAYIELQSLDLSKGGAR